MSKRTRVIGYVRVSKIGGREGASFLSPALQREQIEAVARREDLDVIEVLEELDASGGDSTRPKWNEAIQRVESGEVGGIAVWNFSRFSRSTRDFLEAWDRIVAPGGRLYSATEQTDDSPAGKMLRTILLAVAENERDRATAGFRPAQMSAVERGIHSGGTIPLGYRRDADRRLVPDPDTAPVVLGLFERRAKGLSWVKLAAWAIEQGHEMTDNGVVHLIRNPTYLGQARWGGVIKDDAHEAIVPRGLWQRCQAKRLPSARSGALTEMFLLQGLCGCASCGSTLYLTGGARKTPYYACRNPKCPARAYARAQALDDFVLNTIEERLTGIDYDGVRLSAGLGEDAVRAATWVARPGEGREVEDAEAALEEARADLDGFLADTRLRRVLGEDKYIETASDYVAVANKAEADLADARERTTGGFELVGRLWNTEWGFAERKEWLTRMVRSVTVSKGTEPLSSRAEVELR